MAISPTGLIPEGLMYPALLGDVMKYIMRLHADGDTKVDLFRGWGKAVGVSLSGSQIAKVRNSGTDRSGPLL